MTGKQWLQFIGLSIVWGTSFLWIKIAVEYISPAMLVSFRTLFGVLGLLVVLWFSQRARRDLPKARGMLGVFAFIGLVNVAIPFMLVSWAEQFIESGLASILNSTVPLFSIIIAAMFLPDERFTWLRLGGLLAGFAGVLLLVLPSLTGSATQSLLGQGAMLLSALCYAIAGVYTRLKAGGIASELQALLQLGMASLFMWTFTLGVERPLVFPSNSLTWIGVIWLGLLGSCVAYLLYFSLLKSVGATRAAMVTYVIPLVSVLLGAVFLHEKLTWESLGGGVLIIGGVILANLKKLPWQRPAEGFTD